MKKMKRIIASFLCIVLTVLGLAACGGKAGNETKTPEGTQESSSGQTQDDSDTQQSEDGEWTGEVTKIVMAFPTAGVEPTDLEKVEAAVNEISVNRIGVEVDFKPVSLFEAPSQIPMWIGASEQIDLMFVAFSGLQPYVDQNMLMPLEEYFPENGGYIQQLADAGEPIYDTVSNEHVYGVMTLTDPGFAGGYLISVDHLNAAGLSYKDGDMITLDDLDSIFAAIKEAKPDVYPCGVLGSTQRSGMTFVNDPLGATNASGSVIGMDSTTVVDYYESDEYKNYLEHVRSWYEKGYVLKDAATTDYSLTELITNDTISGYFSEGWQMFVKQLKEQTGRDYIHLMFNEPYTPAISPASNTYWAVPVTSSHPEAAVRFLNLWYEDPYVTNLMVWGIPGEHVEFVDEENGIIKYADGIDPATSPYSYGLGLFGLNRGKTNWAIGQKTLEEDEKWLESANARRTKGYGFTYNGSAMTNQIIAVQAVITEYVSSLETGSADLNTIYPEFINKLKANGIDEIIADKQTQFDAWLAQQ